MTTRDEYIEHLKTSLDHWNAELAKWETKAHVTKTDMRIEYEMQLEALKKHREEASSKLKELQASSGDAWKHLSAGADAAWVVMREAFEKAAAQFHK